MFEDGLDGWEPRDNGTGAPVVAVTTADAHGGAQSALVSDRTSQGSGIRYNVTEALVAGATYELTAWLKFAATLGANIDKLRAEARWNHIAGYDVLRVASQPQDKVRSSNTIDLYFRYDLAGLLKTKSLSLSMNVDNVFDQDPPENRLTGSPGFILASPIGRMIRFGINAGF